MTYQQRKRYPTDFEAKKAILEIGVRMYNRGFVAANDGNISCRVGPNALWTTPTGVSKGYMTQDMLVKVDMSGKVLAGRLKPSSELKMHLRVYEENPDVAAVTHAHPPVATCFAIAGIGLDKAVLPEAVVQLGSVPVAHYATPGSPDVPDSIAPFCTTHNGVLLANHGALTWGKDLLEAYHRLESLEYYAQILMYTGNIIGKANELSCKQVDELLQIRDSLGIHTGGTPPCAVTATNLQDVVSNVPVAAAVPNSQSNILSKQLQPSGSSCSISAAPAQAAAPQPSAPIVTKEQMIAEVVRRVTQKMSGGPA